MQQTPVHDVHNPDLLRFIPIASRRVIEIGCSSGALAREFKKTVPDCDWLGIDIDQNYAELARRFCDATIALDIESADTDFFNSQKDRDCWIFGDALEHLKDPWKILRTIRKIIPNNGCVVACIPNAQHWSVVAKLAIGDFRYEDSGLLDKTHLRWFTRQTIIELFEGADFRVVDGTPRIFDEPGRDGFLPMIAELAKACGVDQNIAVNDAIPLQYVIRAEPT